MNTKQSRREAFEDWYAKDDKTRKSIERDASGYRLIQTDTSWCAWDAAWQAALAQQGREATAIGRVMIERGREGDPGMKWVKLDLDLLNTLPVGTPLYTSAPKQKALDDAMVERLRDHLAELRCYYVEARDGVRGYSAREAQYTRLIDEVDAELTALTGKTEVE